MLEHLFQWIRDWNKNWFCLRESIRIGSAIIFWCCANGSRVLSNNFG